MPKSSTHDDMNLFSVKYRYSMDTKYFFNVKDIPITWRPYSFSFTFLQGKDHDVYKTFPDNTPKDYYAATDQRLLFSMQTNFIIPNNIELYWDWSVLDIGLISYLRNYQFYQDNYSFLGLTGIVNVGVGFRVNL
ncbi:hypothetical protein RT723_10125 [Psychrosphaera aquimarina]|uniref:Uncharacterized protein n=1 Tax=Psychrosphaera aquimarina TaxID=2044854 RepID=A0ABU3R114_9GAMM|nr:hypothetical protein [Psychrosphaera aquimarina]MDU0113344.1 hypothetical protein [Psychrosphaera aquimarina]